MGSEMCIRDRYLDDQMIEEDQKEEVNLEVGIENIEAEATTEASPFQSTRAFTLMWALSEK